jgi:hypothetical protein
VVSFGLRRALVLRWIGVLCGLTGCGPSLVAYPLGKQSFVASERCTQGPLELRWRASGNRWGERILVTARSDAGLGANVDVYMGGSKYGSSTPKTTARTRTPDARELDVPPRRDACLVAPSQPAAANSAGRAAPAMPTGPGSMQGARGVVFRPVEARASYEGAFTLLAEVDARVDGPNKRPLDIGREIRIVLWSELPMDLASVVVTVAHERYWPSDEAAWVAELGAKQREAVEQAAREEAKAADRTARWRDCHAAWNAWCSETFGEPRVATGPSFPEVVAPQRAPTAPEPPAPRTPDGPPPSPRAELAPPKPTPNAEWIAGYWGWTGFEWAWVAGGYRIPPGDLRPAPEPSPAPRPEAPRPAPPRTSGQVWTPGQWVFTVSGWVWVAGAWR